ncbi:unnamed protein product [Adineta ricciae]|uniref:Uncharacterized protein n=1 Tax=Adineta ricciae TaxID=249248 RepID=A0A814D1N2_ADIRI|nr:unnamed protein product [Adineta ricciae]CAF1495140.1 unnamed protein product [Adineta ricciae]
MNRWSRSLPSINALTDETNFNIKPFHLPAKNVLSSVNNLTNVNQVNTSTVHIAPSIATTNDDSDSLTDVSVISPEKPSSVNYEKRPKFNRVTNQYDSVIEIHAMSHNEFVPVDQLYDSLFAYANSFHLDDMMYSPEDVKVPVESPPTVKQRSEPSANRIPTLPNTNLNNNNMIRYRSCEDVYQMNRQPSMFKQPSNECKPTPVVVQEKIDEDDNDIQSDESTTVTDGSKFQWEYTSEAVDQPKKSTINITNNYHITATSKQTTINCTREPEQRSLATKSIKKTALSPIIIRERMRDPYSEHHIDTRPIQLSPPPLRTTPIIIREIVHRPSPPNQVPTKHPSPPTSLNHFHEYNRSSKPPIAPKFKPSLQPERDINQPSKEISIDYTQMNISITKNIHQRENPKHIIPTQYIQHHGSTLYPTDVFQNILTNITD